MPRPFPHSRRRIWPGLAARLALPACIALAGPASAIEHNVSLRVTGTEQTPIFAAGGFVSACGTNCQYAVTSSAGLEDAYALRPSSTTVGGWPVSHGSARPVTELYVAHAIPPPADGRILDGGQTGAARRATVSFPTGAGAGGSRQLAVQSWDSGQGTAVVSLSIRLTTPAGSTRPTYLSFAVPKLQRRWTDVNYVVWNGPFSTNFTVMPTRSQSRATVDVYADGVPLWSSESNLLLPRRSQPVNPEANRRVTLQWGVDLTQDNERVVLYLGNLPGGSSRQLSLVMRTDMRVDGSCVETTVTPQQYLRCHAQRETLSLPSVNDLLDVSVYTR